jgi:hypothetical protein
MTKSLNIGGGRVYSTGTPESVSKGRAIPKSAGSNRRTSSGASASETFTLTFGGDDLTFGGEPLVFTE